MQTPIATLSVGMRQRVMLARVFGESAPIVLLDEPDENLDREIRETFGQLLHRFLATQMSVIATHDAHLLGAASTVIKLLEEGSVEQLEHAAAPPSL
jgi:ATP-binding cassette subfamily F protein uup